MSGTVGLPHSSMETDRTRIHMGYRKSHQRMEIIPDHAAIGNADTMSTDFLNIDLGSVCDGDRV